MAKHFAHAEMVGQIYDAALSPEGWSALPRIFMQVADASSAIVAILQASGEADSVTCEQPVEAGSQYAHYYRFVNPLDPLISALGPMLVGRVSDLMEVLDYRQSEFYTDFARKFATEQLMGTSAIPIAPGVIGHVGVHRSGRTEFRRTQVMALQDLLPHLQRAMQLRLRFGPSPATALGWAALETLAFGCAICDGAGPVVYANRAAVDIATPQSGLWLGGVAGFGTSNPGASRALATLIADAAGGGSGGPLRIVGPDGSSVFVLVAPLPSRFGDQPGHVLVTLRPANAEPGFDALRLAQLFGLTPAESRLALALAAGRSLAEVGEDRAVSQNTLRSQLGSVLRKTGAGSQRELVRLIGLLPPVSMDRR